MLDPDLKIVAATNDYLRVTMTSREALTGRNIFEAFPDNPEEVTATGMANLRASLERVVRTKQPDTMAVQKYDIRRGGESQQFEERYWSPVNTPVVDANGELEYIIHTVEDVTEFITSLRGTANSHTTFERKDRELEIELFRRAQELQSRNTELRSIAHELEQERSRQQQLVDLAQKALSGISRNELMQVTSEIVQSCLSADLSKILEYLPDQDILIMRAGVGWKPGMIGHATFEAAEGSQSGFTLRSKEPVIMEDVSIEERFEIAPAVAQHGVISSASVIVPGIASPFGVLCACSRQKRIFKPSEIKFLQAIANILATAFELLHYQEMRSRLLEHVLTVQEEERKRIARELHDESGQALTSVLVGLSFVRDQSKVPEVRDEATRIQDAVEKTLDDLGRIARGLHPAVLDEHGLVSALQYYVSEYSNSYRITADVKVIGLDGHRLPPATEITLYRVAQEALTNTARHSQARSVNVVLAHNGEFLELSVSDDGRGFDVASAFRDARDGGPHLGLHGMRERVQMHGGVFKVESKPDQGTIVSVSIPWRSGNLSLGDKVVLR